MPPPMLIVNPKIILQGLVVSEVLELGDGKDGWSHVLRLETINQGGCQNFAIFPLPTTMEVEA